MTEAEYNSAMIKLGFSDSHLKMDGYWRMPFPHHLIHLPCFNGGPTWDDRLAYAAKAIRDEDDKLVLQENLNIPVYPSGTTQVTSD